MTGIVARRASVTSCHVEDTQWDTENAVWVTHVNFLGAARPKQQLWRRPRKLHSNRKFLS